jgi:hypothetical protein
MSGVPGARQCRGQAERLVELGAFDREPIELPPATIERLAFPGARVAVADLLP